MCTKIDDYSHIPMDNRIMEKNGWRNSSSSSSSSSSLSSSSSSWFERRFFVRFKKFFRRNSSSLTSDSSSSSRRPSSSTTDDVPSSSIDEQPVMIVTELNEEIPLLIPPSPPPIDFLYDYDRLLVRCLELRERDRNELILRCQMPISIPHADLSIHQKRTILLNWKSYIRLFQNLSRDSYLFQQYINKYYSCQSLINSREQLTFNTQTTQYIFDNLLRKYLDEYVTCLTCQTAQTYLIKSQGKWRIECQLCGSQRTVQRIKWK